MRLNKLSAPMISALRFYAGDADHCGKHGVSNATIAALVKRGLMTEDGFGNGRPLFSLTEGGSAIAAEHSRLEALREAAPSAPVAPPPAPARIFRDPIVAASAAKFPEEFGLRGYVGDTFRISVWASYRGDNGAAVLYTERRREDGSYVDFAKGSESELLREIVIFAKSAPAPVARPAIVVVLEAIKASNAEQKTCTYTTLCSATGLAFEEVRDTVDALSRNRLIGVEYSQERGTSIAAL